MITSEKLKEYGVEKLIKYIRKDPENNIPAAIDFARKLFPDEYQSQMDMIEDIMRDKDSVLHGYIMRMITDIDEELFNKFVINFFLRGVLMNVKVRKKAMEKYGCNIPWAILLDPTTACNLKCKGCWAAEYGNQLNLSYDEIDDIIRQGKELGVYVYIFTGGEPLVRKKDIIKLADKHSDCDFLIFTNSTLIDEEFADEMLRVKNIIPAISVEGSEETNDFRRGDGVYNKVIEVMDLLKERKLPFGISCCYTSKNYEAITSEEFIDEMIDRGAYFAWFFHFMPVGKNTSTELLLSPEQRVHVYNQIRKFRTTKPIFLIDFQNDAEYVGGCVAGGRNYLHINANGDVEPCVFIHYSDSNIKEKTLLEALQSPLFMAYHDGQPFNDNMLRPCPMLENPNLLRDMVKKSQAHSTDYMDRESADELCDKCESYADEWTPVSEEVWKNSARGKKAEAEKKAREEAEAK